MSYRPCHKNADGTMTEIELDAATLNGKAEAKLHVENAASADSVEWDNVKNKPTLGGSGYTVFRFTYGSSTHYAAVAGTIPSIPATSLNSAKNLYDYLVDKGFTSATQYYPVTGTYSSSSYRYDVVGIYASNSRFYFVMYQSWYLNSSTLTMYYGTSSTTRLSTSSYVAYSSSSITYTYKEVS